MCCGASWDQRGTLDSPAVTASLLCSFGVLADLWTFPGPCEVCDGQDVSILPVTGAQQLGRLGGSEGTQMTLTRSQ